MKKGGIFVEDNVIDENKKTILIVDDEKPIVDILVYNLQKEGYNNVQLYIDIKIIINILNIFFAFMSIILMVRVAEFDLNNVL